MTIYVNYEECNDCEERPDCKLLRDRLAIINAAIKALKKLNVGTLPHEVRS